MNRDLSYALDKILSKKKRELQAKEMELSYIKSVIDTLEDELDTLLESRNAIYHIELEELKKKEMQND